jgi:photosystem II stability/assembly factor-like uncharacterized protein
MQKKMIFIVLVILMYLPPVLSQTWMQIPSGTTKNLTAISFPSASIGYIGGEDSLLLKTADGGQTWSQLNYSGVTFFPNGENIVDLKFISELVGFMTVGPYTGSFKTIDGGNTWTAFDAIYSCFTTNLFFFDENNGFLGGSGCFSGEIINKLQSGTWSETNVTPTFISQNGQITNFDFWNSDLGIASSSGDYFFKTIDGGSNWDTIPNNLTPTDSMTSVLFVTSDAILATYSSTNQGTFGIIISYDGGLTWQDEMTSATFFYPNMFALEKTGNGQIFIGGEQSLTAGGINPGLIYEGYGISGNWSYESVAESIRDMDSYNDSVVFAVGQNGYIVANKNLSQLNTEIVDPENELEVFPNPNQGEFILKVGKLKIDEIEITDALGKKVFYLKKLKEGNTIKLHDISAGKFLVRIQSNGHSVVKEITIN